jgi:hypothetical protein
MRERLKKIGRIITAILKKYWWLIPVFYTIKGIAALLFFYFLINA